MSTDKHRKSRESGRASQSKGRTPQEQFATARRLIRLAKGETVLYLDDLRRLKNLPPEIAELRNLESLYLGPNVMELSALSSLKSLMHLSIVSIRPSSLEFLSGLKRLESLYLTHSSVKNIEPLSGLQKLNLLRLDHTQVDDLRPLSKLRALETLWLDSTQVTDIVPLGKIPTLKNLSLAHTAIEDIFALSKLAHLETLSLEGTRITEITALATLVRLEGLSIANTSVKDLAPIAQLQALKRLRLDNTPVVDLSPLEKNRSLVSLWINNTNVRDLKPVAGMTRMQDASITKNLFSVRPGPAGLYFENSPIAKTEPFNRLVRLKQPHRTVDTINELRRQYGLPAHIPQPLDDSEEGKNDAEQLTQRPASHTFAFRDGRIEAQAQVFSARHPEIAVDIRNEVALKVKNTAGRFSVCNAPKRLVSTVDRLISSLGTSLPDLRAGVLQMCFRSLEADLAAYDSEEGRKELPLDALAMLRDLTSSVEDLMGCFPQLADIEAERLSQRLKEADVPAIVDALAEIREEAEGNEVVAPSAINALKSGEIELIHTAEIIESSANDATRIAATNSRDRTVGYMLLAYRNFIAGTVKAGNELAGLGSDTWDDFRKKAPEQISNAGVALLVAALVNGLLGPTAAVGAFALSFKPLHERAKRVSDKLASVAKRLLKHPSDAVE